MLDRICFVTGVESLSTQDGHDLTTARETMSMLIDVVEEMDCSCRPATDRYAAYDCARCRVLARVGGAA